MPAHAAFAAIPAAADVTVAAEAAADVDAVAADNKLNYKGGNYEAGYTQ